MKKVIIAAIAPGRVMGMNGFLPWHIPSDLRRFKQVTSGYPMLMGRKTIESFPRPLPGRHHIVLSRQSPPLPLSDHENVTYVSSLEEGYRVAETLSDKLFIIGGAEIYRMTMQDADEMILTQIEEEFVGDTFFPEWRDDNWVFGERVRPADAEVPYQIVHYHRSGRNDV